MRRLKTVRRPPIYPKSPGHLPYSSLTHPLPLPSRRPSVSFGGFGFRCKAIETIKEVKDDPPPPRDDDEAPPKKPGPPLRLPDLEKRRKVPNTGGPYPVTVVHRADAIVTTDLDTGEHTAALVELKGEPQVGERQPRPAAAKKIRGRTLNVDVLTGGGFETNPKSTEGMTMQQGNGR